MKKIFTILILSSLFAGELEVDGNLTVTGGIDSPTIDALRDDGDYEYVFFWVTISINYSNVYRSGYLKLGQDDFTSGGSLNSLNDFHGEITLLMNDGWKLHSVNHGGSGSADGGGSSWWIFKKPIEE